jgi:bifunctional DNA-binding transcriptional regulator/antitoxin component of YhaV-PrlF toxin-antitoxin module
MINKKIEQFVEYGVKFTDEECEQLGINEGDKFSFEVSDDGILMKKYESIDIDLSEFPREILEFLVKESCEKDITVSQVFESVFDSFIKREKNEGKI